MSGGGWAGAAAAALLVVAGAWGTLELASPGAVGADGHAAPPLAQGAAAEAFHLPSDELLGFVEIPAGMFLMGSDPAVDRLAYENERWGASSPQGRVSLPTYFIGRFEVTVAQYRAFVEATGHAADPAALAAPADHPVASVSWPDALAYARWLDSRLREWSGTPPRLAEALNSGWRVTLPSEAEWEKAARGTEGRVYPWGDEPAGRANYRSRAPTAVGSIPCPECAYGLSDMSGNVWEWTRSPYQPYPYAPGENRADLAADALWVMRGGSFGDDAQNVRAAVRGGADPGVRRPFIGFRLVISSR